MGIINVLPHAPAEVLVCPTGSFDAIELLFSTYGRQNDCVLQFELVDDNEWLYPPGWIFPRQKKKRVLRTMEVHGTDVCDNTYFRFSFDRIDPPKPGKVYRLIVRSPDARPGHFVCVRGTVHPYDELVLARAKACGDRHVGCEFNEELIVAAAEPQKVWLSATGLSHHLAGCRMCEFHHSSRAGRRHGARTLCRLQAYHHHSRSGRVAGAVAYPPGTALYGVQA